MDKPWLYLLSIHAIILSCLPSFSQEIRWNNVPRKGFVYEISNREAQKLLTGQFRKEVTHDLLHSLKDTFDVKKGWTNRPSKGHFILVTINGTKLNCRYTCVFPYQVFLLREYNTLALQVLDLKGNVREDACVKLGMQRIPSDPVSKTYRVENYLFSRKNRYVTVELDGFRTVFDIEKHEVPTYYDYGDEDSGPDFYSYLITDKNRYKPGDLVRFKSYALSGAKFPLQKELDIWLDHYPLQKKLGVINPHRPGSYAGEFRLHDSLNLKLDNNYNLELREKNGRIVSSCSFKYEDYELFGNQLELKLDKTRQYYPDKNQVTITATDMNGLLLKDAQAEILVKTNTILESFQPLSVLPDTLYYKRMNLDPAQPTILGIPSELFQKTNTVYSVTVTVLNSQNQRMERTISANYFYSCYELATRFSNDSICFDLLRNNVPMDHIPTFIKTDDQQQASRVTLPYKEKLNPAIIRYHIENEYINKDLPLISLYPHLEIIGGIEKDSFNIILKNPQKLLVSWYIYQSSELLSKGFGDSLDYKSRITDRAQTYYVELLFSFGGQDQAIRRQFEFREDFLHVNLDLPERVYPGQKVDATISVSNQSGCPVKNVDLTALAVTGKLNYYIPDLPYYGSSSAPRSMGTTFSKNDLKSYDRILALDYDQWASRTHLDTMKYYQFMYPRKKGFIFSMHMADSTQFAPFVMKKGASKQIYVIEVDRRPVFYSWTNQPKGYSFYISSGKKHEITLRLSDRVLVLDSMSFEKNTKTIISMDLDNLPQGTKVVPMDNAFTLTERNRHNSYISQFTVSMNSYAYLQSGREFVPLFSKFNAYRGTPGYGTITAGPIIEEKKTYTQDVILKTTYKHTGGYQYVFEDNIVYKLTPSRLITNLLPDVDMDPMITINDRAVNKADFLKIQAKDPLDDIKWYASTMDINDPDSRLRIFLPVQKASVNIAAVLFQNCQTKKIDPPVLNRFFHDMSRAYNLSDGCHSLIVLYDDGTYLKMDSILFRPHLQIAADLSNANVHKADEVSLKWLTDYIWLHVDYGYPMAGMPRTKTTTFYKQNSTGNLTGTVYDATTLEPLTGATVMIKGTDYGTITDLEGNFSLQIDDYFATLSVSFVGYVTNEMGVTRGANVSVQLTPDIKALEEVVVVGYGTTSKSDLTYSVSSALQGKVSGVDVAQKEPELPVEKPEDDVIQEGERQLYQELLTLNKIRSEFSDVGFWEPRLYTDKKGKATFSITFPDDLTRWDAVVYAMNRYAQTGTARKTIKSYKPIMTELNVPQFLTTGDSAFFLGKVLNYSTDSIIQGKAAWSGLLSGWTKDIRFSQYYTDLLPIQAPETDSITTGYSFTRDDGYLDGEERTVPVIKQGIERADGNLFIMKNGDEIHIDPSPDKKITVTLLDNPIEIYAHEINSLLHYQYDCNEQLASKLIGLINHKLLMQYEGKSFNFDNNVHRIIRRLLKNQNREFLWSWWDVSENTCYWMSAHILTALKCAKDAGYEVNLNVDNMARKAEYKFDILKNYSLYDIDLIHALAGWNVTFNYAKYVPKFDSIIRAVENEEIEAVTKHPYNHHLCYSYLNEKLLLQEIRQMKGLQYQRDSLLKYKKEGVLGDVFFSDGKPERYWYSDAFATNVVAYRLVRNDSALNSLLSPMQMHFLAEREKESWNTYQTSSLILDVLPDLIKEGFKKGQSASVQLSGKENKTVTGFPFSVELHPGEKLQIRKESGSPIFCMNYSHERVTHAKTGVEGFKISTHFSNNSSILEAGKPVDLIVDVTVQKQSPVEQVMIEVPIPGSCSYADKRQNYMGVETHREYFNEKTLICCERLNPGKYSFTLHLLPRFTGKYNLNPAQVALMYFPVVNANTDMKQVRVNP